MPLSEKEIKEAETQHIVRAPVRAKIVVPVQFVPNLIAALQEHWRVFSERTATSAGTRAPSRGSIRSLDEGHRRETPTGDAQILDTLETQHPGADTELHFTTPFELLVATILSAQSTDVGVNLATPALFKRYPDARALAKAKHADVEPLIHSTGFFRAKLARSSAWRRRSSKHGGEVPATMEALVELPGVGRKTANVVLGHALGIPGLPVDRHVLRVRTASASPSPTIRSWSSSSCRGVPPERWTRTSDTLILHGRRICRPQAAVRSVLRRRQLRLLPDGGVSRTQRSRIHGSAPPDER